MNKQKPAHIDPLLLAIHLIRCPSITPEDAGALDVLEKALKTLDFETTRLPFSSKTGGAVDNLYACIGKGNPKFCFAGHTDVVPVGNEKDWSFPPFAAEVGDGLLKGRGASDMKGAIAAFVGALSQFLDRHGKDLPGSISLLITGDEEGKAQNGTRRVLEWLREKGEKIDFCLVGEPTNPKTLGEMIKIGRRGSLNVTVTVKGKQGHVAYPEGARNPVPGLARILEALSNWTLDEGTKHFQPSNLEVTNLSGGTGAFNVIPAEASAKFNIRFNNTHSAKSLMEDIQLLGKETGVPHTFDFEVIGESFLTDDLKLAELVRDAVRETIGTTPEFSTTGGSSDARFIKDMCPVAEFGLTGETIHAVDEHARTEDIENLARVYERVLEKIFGKGKQ